MDPGGGPLWTREVVHYGPGRWPTMDREVAHCGPGRWSTMDPGRWPTMDPGGGPLWTRESYSVYMRWLEMPYIIFRFMCNPKMIPGLTLDTLLDGLEPSPY
ncbi:unnamed protein product [Gadus morhua 'NCC']